MRTMNLWRRPDFTVNRLEFFLIYLGDMRAEEYFIHQPEMKKPSEFRGWRRNPGGDIVEITPDAQGGLFSEALNLYFRWEDQLDTHVRLLRPYLPDSTPITTSIEEQQLRMEEQQLRIEEQQLRMEAETRAAEETQRRREAETRAAEETQRRREAEIEIERLRRQLANH